MTTIQEVFSKEEIAERVKDFAEKLNRSENVSNTSLVCVLTGGLYFFSDLSKLISKEVICDFVGYSSYHDNLQSSGVFTLDLSHDIKGRDVILVDDIIDTGSTAKALMAELEKKGANSVRFLAVLGNVPVLKKDSRMEALFDHDGKWMCGYGMDNKGFDRQGEDIVPI